MTNKNDIPEEYRGTAVEELLCHHNFGHEPDSADDTARIAILTCIDPRVTLRLPDGFAFVLRNAGAKTSGMEFALSFAVAVCGVRTVAVIGHGGCNMAGVGRHKADFVDGLERCGWKRSEAERFFFTMSPRFATEDIADSIADEARRLRGLYAGVLIAPLYYSVKDGLLYTVDERLGKGDLWGRPKDR